jgi:hypothetical protein
LALNLASSFMSLFNQKGDPKIAMDAEDLNQEITHLLPEDRLEFPIALNNLANIIMGRTGQTKDASYLVEAISLYKQALTKWGPTHIDYAFAVNNLAHALTT